MSKVKTKSKSKLLAMIIVGVVLLLIASASVYSVLLVNAQKNSDRIIQGVLFYGTDLSGLTVAEAEEAVNAATQTPISEVIQVKYHEKEITFAPEGVGINYDSQRIAEKAFLTGREGSAFTKLKDIFKGKYGGISLEPDYQTDREFFQDAIGVLVREQGVEFKDFDVKVENQYAKVKISNEAKQIDYEALFQKVQNVIDGKEEPVTALPLKDSEPITADRIYEEIYVEPRNARADIVNGQTKITPQQVGVLVNREEIQKQLLEGKKEFQVKVSRKYPEITTDNLKGDFFNEVLGTFKSNYDAKIQGRTVNVNLAAQRINNTVLNHGEVFSFNKVVGKRSPATGFSTAIVYTSNGLQEEIGGGICQVSSSLYNAALYADLDIVERRNHMYTVAYVKNGLDATVSYGLIDFRFRNNQPEPIKIVARASGGVLTVSILGKKTNDYRVELLTNTMETYDFQEKVVGTKELSPGARKVKQNGSKGYKVSATKIVKNAAGQVIRSESLGISTYRALDKIIEAGMDGEGNIPAVSIPVASPGPSKEPDLKDPEQTKEPGNDKPEPGETKAPEATKMPKPSKEPEASILPGPDITPIPSATPTPEQD